MKEAEQKRRLVPVAAVTSVLTVGIVVAVAVSSPDSQTSSRAQASPVSEPPAAQVPAGNPEDPSTWRLPIEAYLPAKADARLMSSARDTLIDACMRDAGHEAWVPAPDLPELGGRTLVDWRYGIHDASLAAERGYHPAAAEQKAYDEAMQIGAVDKSGSDQGKVEACARQADGTVPAPQHDDLAQQISGSSFAESQRDPEVVRAFAGWSACMATAGYQYQRPMDASDDAAFSDPSHVAAKEIATAKADIACREAHQVARIWFDAETRLQQKAIKANHLALDKIRADNQSSARAAAKAVQ